MYLWTFAKHFTLISSVIFAYSVTYYVARDQFVSEGFSLNMENDDTLQIANLNVRTGVIFFVIDYCI